MSSGGYWALYASHHRQGAATEHHLAGARLGPFGATIEWTVPHGWAARFHYGRVGVTFTVALSPDDPRLLAFLAPIIAVTERAIRASRDPDPWRRES